MYFWDITKRQGCLESRESTLTRNQVGEHTDLYPSLQNYENYKSIISSTQIVAFLCQPNNKRYLCVIETKKGEKRKEKKPAIALYQWLPWALTKIQEFPESDFVLWVEGTAEGNNGVDLQSLLKSSYGSV